MQFLAAQFDPARPTFFERAMAASLGSFVRPAFQHLSYAAAISYPASLVAAAMEAYGDELCTLLLLVGQGYCLRNASSTVEEWFYGLTRVRAIFTRGASASKDPSPRRWARDLKWQRKRRRLAAWAESRRGTGLSKMEIIISLLDSVLLPYIFLKLDKIHGEMRRRRNNEENTVQRSSNPLVRMANLWRSFFFQWYPRLRIIGYLTNFAYNILYAMGANANVSCILHLCGIRVVRRQQQAGMGDAIAQSEKLEDSWQSVNGKPSSWKDGLVRALQLSAIASIAAFKVTEWAYSPEVQRAIPKTVARPPPAPRSCSTGTAEEGEGPGQLGNSGCPICNLKVTNPCVLPSGHAFCFPCAFQYVSEEGKDPVTLAPCATEDVRRIFLS